MIVAQAPAITESVVYMVGSVASGSAFLAWFINNQFSYNRRIFYRVMSRHNKEDDDRFEGINHEIWQILLRNSRVDGDQPPKRTTFPRRRYLQESDEENDDALDGSSVQ